MSTRMRLGLVGAGAAATRYHLPAIRAVPEVEAVIVADADAGRAQEFSRRYCIPRASASHRDLQGAVDIAVVVVSNAFHASVSRDLLLAGIHVLCEKPMARTVEECRSMIEAAERGQALLSIGHNRRFRPHIQLARRLILSGTIGSLLRIEAEEGSRSDWSYSGWYLDPAASGGGALINVGVHAIDLIRWIAGEFERVRCDGDGTGGDVETEISLDFSLAGGVAGGLIVSRRRELRQQIVFTGTEGRMRVDLWGGGLRVEGTRRKAFKHLGGLGLAVPRRPMNDSFVEQLNSFVAAASGRGGLLVDGRDGMAAVDVVERAYADRRSRAPAPATPIVVSD